MPSTKMTKTFRPSIIVQHKHKPEGIANRRCRICKVNSAGDRYPCSQCIRSGYIIKSSLGELITKQVHILPLKGLEQDNFTWFLERTAFKLPGTFYTPAFVELMFQASTLEPAVRHAIVSLASAHQEEVHASGLEDQRSSFTIQQYGLAIAKLKPCLSMEDTRSLRLALMISMIFNAKDALRGSYTSALIHLEHGVKLLSHLKGVVCSNQLDGWLISLLIRATVQAKFLGQLSHINCRDLIELTPVTHCPEFRNIFHARRDIENILMRIFDILDHGCSDVYLKQEQIMLDLQKWKDMYEMSVAKPLSIQNSLGYDILIQYYRMGIILAAACLEPWNEMVYDDFTSEFTSIVDDLVRIHKRQHPGPQDSFEHRDPEISSPNSIADIGIITPLHFLAVHCRQPYLRRRALALLSIIRCREGIFSAPLILVLVSRLIETEEGSFFSNLNFENLEPEEIDEAQIPEILPQTHRLRKITIVLPEDKDGILRLNHIRGDDWICREYDLVTETWSASRACTPS